jgi:beta,beta-carotene 9',10'-dioxygenase
MNRADGGMLNYAAKIGPRSTYRFFHLAPDAEEPDVIASLPVSEPAYMHSFGLTERWLLLAEFPLVVNPASIPLSGRPYIENYRWKPELGTRLTLIDRATGEASGPFETDPFFSFHHINAYEENGSVVADLCTYADAQLIDDLYLDRLRAGEPVTPPETRRFRIDPAAGGVTHEPLTDVGFELPRINYGRCNERPYRYAWGAAPAESGWLIDTIVRADLADGSTSTWSLPDHFPGEPVFVRRPGAEDEDDGVLLSVVLDANKGTSSLLVLDARDLSELAHAEAPHHIPFGFHGQFAQGI